MSDGVQAPGKPDFGRLAERYDELRPVDGNWREVADAVWDEGDFLDRRILDVGCGTGRFATLLATRGATVSGVDASSEMLAQARAQVPGGVELREAHAEALPFEDSRFEGAVAWLVLHLVDRARALPELRRVLCPDGRAVVVTFPPEYFERIWLARFFPSLIEIDRARFPEPEVLAGELRAAGFARVRTRSIEQRATISREDALRKLRGRYISTLLLLPEDEYRNGVARAEQELADVTEYGRDWVILTALC